jgi:uncharacterized coiled-coil protein SlyX
MTIEERMDRLEAKLGSQDELVRELRDAMTVNARLESRHSQMVEDHQKWLEEETLAIARHREWMTHHGEALARHDEALARHDEAVARHDEALARHEVWLEEHDRGMRELRERDKLLDDRIAKLVSGLGEFMRREVSREPGIQ